MMRMLVLSCLGWICALAGSPLTLRAESLENRFYRVQLDLPQQQLSVTAMTDLPCRIPRLSLGAPVTRVQPQRVEIAGLGSGQAWTLEHADGSSTQLVLLDDWPWIGLRRSVVNASAQQDQATQSLGVLQAELDFGVPAGQLVARGTAGLYPLDKHYGSYVFGAVADPATSTGVVCGWATNNRGQGIVFPDQEGDTATLRARVDYGELLLRPATREAGELLLLGLFADVQTGLERYADATAAHLQIRLRPLPSVYCTWYHAGASDEQRLARNTDFAARELQPWGLAVMQIDDGWQAGLKDNGPKRNFDTHHPQGSYPSGMRATAEHIRQRGMVPGIWFMPFSGTWLDPFFADKQEIFYQVGAGDPSWTRKEMANQQFTPDRPETQLPYSTHWAGTSIDCSHPKSQQYIRQMVHRIARDWGYQYFKMDGIHCGTGSRQRYIDNQYQEDDLGKTRRHNPYMTPIESYRLGWQIIRETAGDEVFFLGCCQVQNLRCFGTTFGALDAMRVGPDNGAAWKNAERGPRYGGRYYFLNKRVWHCDPDPFYVRASLTDDQARTLASWIALAGQLTASSYDYDQLPLDRLDIIRRVMPTHDVKTSRPLDFLQRDVPCEWSLIDTRGATTPHPAGPFQLVDGRADSAVHDPVQAGTGRGADSRGVRLLERSICTLRQRPDRECIGRRQLSDPVAVSARDYPQLVSTSRHVTQGVVDVLSESWDASRRVLSGSSRVVAGDLYELRVALPAQGSWVVDNVTCGKSTLVAVDASDAAGARVKVNPQVTGTVEWSIRFRD